MTNPHHTAAMNLIAAVKHSDTDLEDRAQALVGSITESNLAIAFEQVRVANALETANMIAYLTAATDDRVAYPVPVEVRKSLQAKIDTRLGLA